MALRTYAEKKIKKNFLQCIYGLGKNENYLKWKHSNSQGNYFSVDSNGQIEINKACRVSLNVHLMWYNSDAEIGIHIAKNGSLIHMDAVGASRESGYRHYDLSNYVIDVLAGDVISVNSQDIGINSYQASASYLTIIKLD